jgi:hypothetical protein
MDVSGDSDLHRANLRTRMPFARHICSIEP